MVDSEGKVEEYGAGFASFGPGWSLSTDTNSQSGTAFPSVQISLRQIFLARGFRTSGREAYLTNDFLVCNFLADDFRRRNLFLAFQTFRLVDAERLFSEIVAGCRISACAATHANIFELAAAAFSLQILAVAEFVEHYRIFPDVGESLFSQIPRQSRQISTGIDLALMRNETHGGSGQASLGHSIHV